MCSLKTDADRDCTPSLRLLVVVGLAGTATILSAEACDDDDRRAAGEETYWEAELDIVGSSNPLELGIPDVPETVGFYLWEGNASVSSETEGEGEELDRENCSVVYDGKWQLLADKDTLMRVMTLLHHLKEVKEGAL